MPAKVLNPAILDRIGNDLTWPDKFDAFDATNPQNARVWLAVRKHSDFKAWQGAIGQLSKYWESLDSCIRVVTGVTGAVWGRCEKNAFSSVFSAVTSSRSHLQDDEKEELGVQHARLLVEASVVEWKDEIGEWLAKACTTLAPRTIHLMKRRLNHEKTKRSKPKSEDKDDDSDATKSATSQTSKRRAASSTTTTTPSRAKKPKTIHHLERSSSATQVIQEAGVSQAITPVASSSDVRNSVVAQKTLPLCSRTIHIILDITTAADVPPWIPIHLAAIVEPYALELHPHDIHVHHLSWELFTQLLSAANSNYDVSRSDRWLTCSSFHTVSGSPQDSVKVIKNKDDFQEVVGLSSWAANKEFSHQPFVFNIVSRE